MDRPASPDEAIGPSPPERQADAGPNAEQDEQDSEANVPTIATAAYKPPGRAFSESLAEILALEDDARDQDTGDWDSETDGSETLPRVEAVDVRPTIELKKVTARHAARTQTPAPGAQDYAPRPAGQGVGRSYPLAVHNAETVPLEAHPAPEQVRRRTTPAPPVRHDTPFPSIGYGEQRTRSQIEPVVAVPVDTGREAPNTSLVRRRPTQPGTLVDEWEEEPTALYQRGRTPPVGIVPRTTTGARGMMAHPFAESLELYGELLGGPLEHVRLLSGSSGLLEHPMLPALRAPDSLVASAYRRLGNVVEETASMGRCKILGVTSATERDGKTLTAANLALILSEDPARRVALVDCNLRRPGVGPLLGLTDEQGLVGVCKRQVALIDTLVRMPARDLYVLAAGEPCVNPTEILRSRVFAAVLRRLELEMDIVVVDAPSILPNADVGLLGRYVDRFVVVVRAGRTKRARLGEALRQFEPAKLLGLVFNEEQP